MMDIKVPIAISSCKGTGTVVVIRIFIRCMIALTSSPANFAKSVRFEYLANITT